MLQSGFEYSNPVSQTFFKSLSTTPHFPNPHPTDSGFYPNRFYSDPVLSTQMLQSGFEYSNPVSQTFFKSLSTTPHFPNPHPTDSGLYQFRIFSQPFYSTTILYYARGGLGWLVSWLG